VSNESLIEFLGTKLGYRYHGFSFLFSFILVPIIVVLAFFIQKRKMLFSFLGRVPQVVLLPGATSSFGWIELHFYPSPHLSAKDTHICLLCVGNSEIL
jgi:hypothetical protein